MAQTDTKSLSIGVQRQIACSEPIVCTAYQVTFSTGIASLARQPAAAQLIVLADHISGVFLALALFGPIFAPGLLIHAVFGVWGKPLRYCAPTHRHSTSLLDGFHRVHAVVLMWI